MKYFSCWGAWQNVSINVVDVTNSWLAGSFIVRNVEVLVCIVIYCNGENCFMKLKS